MIKFYIKLLNKLVTENLLLTVTILILIGNVLFRLKPSIIYQNNDMISNITNINLVPTNLFNYCDVYLLLIFIIILYFFLGTDFTNSIEDISLASGGSKVNKFMYRKLLTTLVIYCILYIITFINIYTIYKGLLPIGVHMISLSEIIFYSLTTNVFIITLSLVILYIVRNIPISIVILTSYYLIEEALWRCKVTQTSGILAHIYLYYDYSNGELIRVKTMYIVVSCILMFILYRLSMRKRGTLNLLLIFK